MPYKPKKPCVITVAWSDSQKILPGALGVIGTALYQLQDLGADCRRDVVQCQEYPCSTRCGVARSGKGYNAFLKSLHTFALNFTYGLCYHYNRTGSKKPRAVAEVQKADFALQEAALYLDGHPKNQNALDYFKHFQDLAYNARITYENYFGPLMFQNQSDSNYWKWIDGPWPWEGEA